MSLATSTPQLRLPPGAVLDSAASGSMNLPPGATLESPGEGSSQQSSAISRLATNTLSGLGVTSNEDAWNFFRHPLNTVIHSFEAQGELAKKARDAYDKGDYMGALQHALNYLVPFVGQQTDQAGEQLKQGDIAGGVGRTIGTAIPLLLSPEARAATSDVVSAAADTASKALKTAGKLTPKQAAQGMGIISGAGLGHGTLSIPGAYFGAEGGGRLAEGILGKEFANKPIGLPSRVTGGPAEAPQFAPEEPIPGTNTRPSIERISEPSDPLDRLRNQELPPEQPDYIPPRPSIERLTPKEKAAAITEAGSGEEVPPAANTSPKKLNELLNQATGGDKGKIVRGVPLRNQPTAQAAPAAPAAAAEPSTASQIAASVAPKLPEGFTPVDSSVLRGYKYDADAQEFSSITNRGDHYIHGGVSPEEAEAFEAADSKGKAWNQLRSQNPLVAKVVNGNRQPYVPVTRGEIPEGVEAPPGGTMRAIENALPASQAPKLAPDADVNAAIAQSGKRTIVTDPETGRPEFSDVVAAKAAKRAPGKKNLSPAEEDLSNLWQQELARVRAQKSQ